MSRFQGHLMILTMDIDTVRSQADLFDDFLRKVDPLIQSVPLYRSLEFACVAVRRGADWVLMSGKAVLSTEPHGPVAQIMPVVHAGELLALSGRIAPVIINDLVHNLRDSWVIKGLGSDNIRLTEEGTSNYTWTMPTVYAVDKSSNPSRRWNRVLSMLGTGPDLSAVLTPGSWQQIEAVPKPVDDARLRQS